MKANLQGVFYQGNVLPYSAAEQYIAMLLSGSMVEKCILCRRRRTARYYEDDSLWTGDDGRREGQFFCKKNNAVFTRPITKKILVFSAAQ